MEDVLAVYERPPDPARPLVCLDETSKVLTADVRPPQGPAPGRPARQDTEYARNRQEGQVNLFLACAPHLGWRHVSVTPTRTASEVAHALRSLVDEHFPQAERLVLVTDHLNVHSPASLYRAFPPAEARRIAERLEWHYPPPWQLAQHGRTGAVGPQPAVSEAAHPGSGHPARRGGGLGGGAQ